MKNETQGVGCIILIALAIVGGLVWWQLYDDCKVKHGVLVDSSPFGWPTCVEPVQ